MTTHEMILLCSSLQGVGTCILLCWVSGFCHSCSLRRCMETTSWKGLGTIAVHDLWFMLPLYLLLRCDCTYRLQP